MATHTAPAPALEPLETHAEWRARDVADRSRWTYRLSDAEVAELEAALAHARARCPDVLDITREDFPLPTLAAKIAAFEDELINGRGFQLISGLPAERYSDADASAIYWGIGMHLGTPWPQNKHGHLLGDVTDQGRRPSDPTARGRAAPRRGSRRSPAGTAPPPGRAASGPSRCAPAPRWPPC